MNSKNLLLLIGGIILFGASFVAVNYAQLFLDLGETAVFIICITGFFILVVLAYYLFEKVDLSDKLEKEIEIKIVGNKMKCIEFSRYENLFSAIVEVVVSALGILLSIPFAVTLPVSHYERLRGVPIGSRWYVGLILILITFSLLMALKMFKGRSFKIALYTNSFLIFWIFVMALFLNSMWQYGVAIWPGYFESYKLFFSSEIVVSIILGLVATSSISIIPYGPGRIKVERHT